MAIVFQKSINQNFLYRTLRYPGSIYGSFYSVGFFPGTQPTAETLLEQWTTYRSSCLGTMTAATFNNPNFTFTGVDGNWTVDMPTSRTLTAIGTDFCEWAVMLYMGRNDLSTVPNASFNMTSSNMFIVVPVTDSVTPGGIFRMDDCNLVSGETYTVTGFTWISSGGQL